MQSDVFAHGQSGEMGRETGTDDCTPIVEGRPDCGALYVIEDCRSVDVRLVGEMAKGGRFRGKEEKGGTLWLIDRHLWLKSLLCLVVIVSYCVEEHYVVNGKYM